MTVGTTMLELLRDQRGATAIEYGLIAALIVLGMMTALSAFAESANEMFNEVSTKTGKAMEKAEGG
ncbi:MAG: Flp family type IVb pilin [Novosphingobium sp.]